MFYFQTVITSIDVPLSSRPWRYAHIYLAAIYGFAYVGFQLIYILGFDGKDAGGNDWIYPILDWKNEPAKAVGWVVAVLVMLVISYGFLCLLVFARDKLWEKLFGNYQKETTRLTVQNRIDVENSTRHYDTMQQ